MMAADTTDHVVLMPEDITKETLKKMFEMVSEKGLKVSVDEDGDVLLSGSYRFYCVPNSESGWIRMATSFRTSAEATLGERLMYVNKVNHELPAICAYVGESGGIGFEFYILTHGGITLVNLLLASLRFDAYLEAALKKDERGVFDRS